MATTAPAAEASAGVRPRRRFEARTFAATYSTIAIFVVLVLVASFISTSFFSSRNIENVRSPAAWR